MSSYSTEPGDQLRHYGVKGMKWGIRKDTSKGYSKDNLRKKSERPGRPKLTEQQKKIGKVVLAAGAVTALGLLGKKANTRMQTAITSTATKRGELIVNQMFNDLFNELEPPKNR